MPEPVVLYPCMRNICGRVTTSIPSPRDVARKYGPIVHTWVVSGRRPVKNAVREGAQTAMDTKALRICVPLAASRLRFGVIARPPYTSRAVPRSSTTLHTCNGSEVSRSESTCLTIYVELPACVASSTTPTCPHAADTGTPRSQDGVRAHMKRTLGFPTPPAPAAGPASAMPDSTLRLDSRRSGSVAIAAGRAECPSSPSRVSE